MESRLFLPPRPNCPSMSAIENTLAFFCPHSLCNWSGGFWPSATTFLPFTQTDMPWQSRWFLVLQLRVEHLTTWIQLISHLFQRCNIRGRRCRSIPRDDAAAAHWLSGGPRFLADDPKLRDDFVSICHPLDANHGGMAFGDFLHDWVNLRHCAGPSIRGRCFWRANQENAFW